MKTPPHSTTRGFNALMLSLLLWLSACSSVPGVSIVSDSMDMQKFSPDNALNVKEEEIREIMAKPVPPPPGLSHDIGLLRKGGAAFTLADRVMLRQLVAQASRTMTNEEMFKGLLSTLIFLESGYGNLQQALKDASNFEARLQSSARRSGRNVLATIGEVEAVYAYIEIAYMAGNFAQGERVRKQYLGEVLNSPGYSPFAKLVAGIRNATTEGRAMAFFGDLEGGYERIEAGLNEYVHGYASLKDKPTEDRMHEGRMGSAYVALGQIALTQGRFSLTQQNLMAMRAILESTNRLEKSDAATYHMLSSAYWGTVGEYQRALDSLEDWRRLIRPTWRGIPLLKQMWLVQKAGLLASMNRWDEAARHVSQLNDNDLRDEGIARDYGIAAKALIGAVAGTVDEKTIKAFTGMERRYRQWRGTELSSAYFLAKTIVHFELARRERREQNLLLAVEAGREMSYAINAKLARGNGRESTLGPELLRRAKEAYLKAASSMVGQGGVTMDDVMDALQLNQSNEVDMDVSSAAARLKRFQGISPAKLRELQDLQQKTRGAQALVSEYSRSVDADQTQLAAYVTEANQITARLNRLIAELKSSAPQLAQAFGQGGNSMTVAQLQQRLGPNDALVAFVPTPDGTFTLFVTKTGAEQRLLSVSNQAIGALVERIRRSVAFDATAKVPGFDIDASRELHTLLFGWLEQRMTLVKSLTVSASGSLGSIPFGLLVQDTGNAPAGQPYADVPWLIRSKAINHAPSLSSWLAVTDPKSRTTSSGFIAWADPDFAGRRSRPMAAGVRGAVRLDKGSARPSDSVQKRLTGALPYLPETAEEARSVALALGGTAQDVLLADAATRSSVLSRSISGELASKNVLMFATHGLAPADMPGLTQPALAMAQEKLTQGPSLLQLDDVVGLRLNADWVVLSACNTASADRPGGDPLSGLARGFFFAGARGMLVTHWEVETRSAAEITRRTFEHYARNRNLSRAEALQRTAIDMIESASGTPAHWAHPAYWSPYALVGDGRRGANLR